jgi:hypothetical protein
MTKVLIGVPYILDHPHLPVVPQGGEWLKLGVERKGRGEVYCFVSRHVDIGALGLVGSEIVNGDDGVEAVVSALKPNEDEHPVFVAVRQCGG